MYAAKIYRCAIFVECGALFEREKWLVIVFFPPSVYIRKRLLFCLVDLNPTILTLCFRRQDLYGDELCIRNDWSGNKLELSCFHLFISGTWIRMWNYSLSVIFLPARGKRIHNFKYSVTAQLLSSAHPIWASRIRPFSLPSLNKLNVVGRATCHVLGSVLHTQTYTVTRPETAWWQFSDHRILGQIVREHKVSYFIGSRVTVQWKFRHRTSRTSDTMRLGMWIQLCSIAGRAGSHNFNYIMLFDVICMKAQFYSVLVSGVSVKGIIQLDFCETKVKCVVCSSLIKQLFVI